MMEDNLQSVTIMTVIISNNDTLGPNASTTTKENLEFRNFIYNQFTIYF